MPPPPKIGGPAVTNIRNTSSPHWRAWLKPENRCLVPANSFAEYAPETNPETKKNVVWFGLDDIFGERCADLPRRRTSRTYPLSPNSRRATPPIGPDLIYDRHNSAGPLSHEKLMRSVELHDSKVIPLARDMLA
jgi:hypothetical protein